MGAYCRQSGAKLLLVRMNSSVLLGIFQRLFEVDRRQYAIPNVFALGAVDVQDFHFS
jgi:hypothetical protein